MFRKRITVPGQSEIEIKFPVFAQADEKFIVELFVHGAAVDKQQFSSSSVNNADPMVLILDDGPTAYSYFKDMKIERKLTISIAQSHDLPEFWEILEGVNLIVLGDIDPHKILQPQIDSLRAWVEGGGILVVSTDERWTRLQGSFVEDWLPVRMYGARPIEAIDSLRDRYGKALTMSEDLKMCESLPWRGRVLASLQGLPLLAYHQVGLGAVVFAAVRLDASPISHWAGLATMWEELFNLREKPLEVRRTALEPQREQMLSNITGLPVPQPSFVAELLLAYIAVVLGLFLAFRWRNKLEWAWCSLVLLAPITAGFYHSIGRSARQEFKSTLNEISIVKMAGVLATNEPRPHLGWVESFHSLYSAKDATYNLRGETADALITQGSVLGEASRTVVPAINVVAYDLTVAERMRVNEGGLQSFKSFSTRQYEGNIGSSLVWDANGLEGDIINGLGFRLEDAMVLFNRQLVSLRNLNANETRRLRIADPKNSSYSPLLSLGGASLDTTRKRILENLATPLSNYSLSQDQPLLIGWTQQAVARIDDVAHGLRRKGLTLMLVSLPFQRAGGDILIPKGVCPVRIASALSFRSGKWVQMPGFASGSEIEIDFRIPPELRDMTVGRIRGHFEIENPGNDMKASIAALDWTADANQPQKAWVNLGTAVDFTLPDPARFVQRPLGRVRLKLTVSALSSKRPLGDTPSLRAFKWLVRDVDIEIKGKVS